MHDGLSNEHQKAILPISLGKNNKLLLLGQFFTDAGKVLWGAIDGLTNNYWIDPHNMLDEAYQIAKDYYVYHILT